MSHAIGSRFRTAYLTGLIVRHFSPNIDTTLCHAHHINNLIKISGLCKNLAAASYIKSNPEWLVYMSK